MSRDNLCIGFERDYKDIYPKTYQLFRKIIDKFDKLSPQECIQLYDIFCGFINEAGSEKYEFTTKTYLV